MTKEESAKLLDKAAQICVSKHAGQRDKMGCAYFQHPMRVAMRCKTDEEKMVALLHDTIEDTDVTAEYLLAEGFPQSVVDGIISVTKREGESYEDFVARAKQNPLGSVVKLHDLEDNLDVFRLDTVSPEMAARFTKYLAAHRFLLNDDIVQEITLPEKESVVVSRPIRRVQDIYREDRAKINSHIMQRMKTDKGGFRQGQDTIMVTWYKEKGVQETDAINTFINVIQKIGYAEVEALDIRYKDRFSLVTTQADTYNYKEATAGYFVLSNCPNKMKAIYLNQIADALDLPYKAELVPKVL